ncbi:hypothetical protein JL09_g6194 [Pichia kudriavzevii]|uniref:Uncharacterized protein n=1 Tax=Pichia kudriavzevii TaxID=4909 RepID=A0A099NRT6_PICKU|nr:hypothetical protein JL09_g6194 [Pichia kudriavzevii]
MESEEWGFMLVDINRLNIQVYQ